MKRLIVIVLLPLLSFSLSPEEIIEKLEFKLKSIKSLKADFEQIYYSTSVSTPLKEKGMFYFKKPSFMRWDYLAPEEKTFLYFQGEFIFYLPEDNQVIKSKHSKEKFESEILSILTGQGEIRKNYQVELAEFIKSQPENWLVKLKPFQEREFSFILLEIEKRSWLIERAMFFDWAGNKTEFLFSNIKENIAISPDLFVLNLPPDVEVIIEQEK